MEQEVWLPVLGFEGIYDVSSFGRVRRDGRLVEPRTRGDGHKTVTLTNGRTRKTQYVHLLVARAFLGDRPPGLDVMRLNGDKADLRAANLAYWPRGAIPRGPKPVPTSEEIQANPTPESVALPGEEWREVPGYAGRYFASSTGRLWTKWDSAGRARLFSRRPIKSPRTYPTVMLRQPDGRVVTRTVHSLIAETFLGPRPARHEVCHCDGNRNNAAVSNLRYDTHIANLADAARHGSTRRGSAQPMAKLTETQVAEARRRYVPYSRTSNMKTLAAEYGVSSSTMCAAILGRNWAHV